jgi:hypothetical protein
VVDWQKVASQVVVGGRAEEGTESVCGGSEHRWSAVLYSSLQKRKLIGRMYVWTSKTSPVVELRPLVIVMATLH